MRGQLVCDANVNMLTLIEYSFLFFPEENSTIMRFFAIRLHDVDNNNELKPPPRLIWRRNNRRNKQFSFHSFLKLILFRSRNFGYSSIDRSIPEYKSRKLIYDRHIRNKQIIQPMHAHSVAATRKIYILTEHLGTVARIWYAYRACRPYRDEKISLTARDFQRNRVVEMEVKHSRSGENQFIFLFVFASDMKF